MTDEQIIDRVRSGDTRMFAKLVHRYQDGVFSMAVRFTGSATDAQDIGQEVFLKVYRGLIGFKGDAKFSTWLYRITYNLCTDWIRKNRNPARRFSSLEETGELRDEKVNLEDDLLSSEGREGMKLALDELDERYRSVVVLLYYQKRSYEDIAKILDIPVKTVETRLYRARKMLRERMAGNTRGGNP